MGWRTARRKKSSRRRARRAKVCRILTIGEIPSKPADNKSLPSPVKESSQRAEAEKVELPKGEVQSGSSDSPQFSGNMYHAAICYHIWYQYRCRLKNGLILQSNVTNIYSIDMPYTIFTIL
eukprot:TRINITY_DN8425_c0_g2_i4.p2 TRINITY_DN8425_c0_g2~~TRINITY_DN8425_c0_g2_i4.p2  ORF type:complete len:121 (-),score=15.73 TRINITY_DN8425_c0_g2_i4:20-382(-)